MKEEACLGNCPPHPTPIPHTHTLSFKVLKPREVKWALFPIQGQKGKVSNLNCLSI